MYSMFRKYFSTDLAIDLGTANTLIFVRDRGIVAASAAGLGRRGFGLDSGPTGLRWAFRQQLLSGWMLVPLGFTGAVLWAWHAQHSRVAIGLGVLISYVVPLLILRPRWLGMDSRDRSWLPSGAALGVFVVCDVLTRAADAGLSALGGPAGSTVSFVLEVFVAWLSASALIFVRSWRATVPHLASRLSHRFAMLAVMGSLRPLALFAAWLLGCCHQCCSLFTTPILLPPRWCIWQRIYLRPSQRPIDCSLWWQTPSRTTGGSHSYRCCPPQRPSTWAVVWCCSNAMRTRKRRIQVLPFAIEPNARA